MRLSDEDSVDTLILTPPKLYIDTNHLINIAKLRRGEQIPRAWEDAYAFIDDCLSQRHFGVVFSETAPLDWVDGNATLRSALEIAAVLDSAKLLYLLAPDDIVWISEILDECSQLAEDLRVPSLQTLQPLVPNGLYKSWIGIMANAVPTLLGPPPQEIGRFGLPLPTAHTFQGVQEYARIVYDFKVNSPDDYRERVDGYKASLSDDIAYARPKLRFTKEEKVGWMKRYLRIDLVLEKLNPGLDSDALLRRVSIERCPGVDLWFRAREQRIRAKHDPAANEVDDWMFLPVVPYADLVLTDRAFRDVILRADKRLAASVLSDPKEAESCLRRWTS